MSCDILFRVEGPVYREALAARFRVQDAWDGPAALPHALRAQVQVVVTNGTVGLSAKEMAMLPSLGLVCTVGTGFEAVDMAAARARDIAVTHAAGVNAVAVAEHVIGMILALTRRICRFDAAARAGAWRGDVGTSSLMSGRRIGIFGMGGIGQRVGRLAEAFGMPVSYCSRAEKDLPGWTFHRDLRTLAHNVDVLVIAAPGGPATFHVVDDAVLDALGPRGVVVNVGRGSIIETRTLIAALETGRIGGAALDVLEEEPEVPEPLRAMPNVVLSPHVAGLALEVQQSSAALMLRNIDAFLSGQPLVTPVPRQD